MGRVIVRRAYFLERDLVVGLLRETRLRLVERRRRYGIKIFDFFLGFCFRLK